MNMYSLAADMAIVTGKEFAIMRLPPRLIE